MHYGHFSFSTDHKRGLKTIEPLDGKSLIGQRRGLSKVMGTWRLEGEGT
jgi:hypothetical protein